MYTKIDYYELLEITRTADGEEIKKAYRKKALQYHPDRNQDNKDAEEQFKLVSEAFEVLSNSQKRQIYDQFGHEGLQGNGFGGGFHSSEDIFSAFGDIFEDFFGGFGGQRGRGQGQQRARRGRDVQVEVKLEFLEACFGSKKEILVSTQVTCETCDGTGGKEGAQPESCSYCNGYGQVQVNQGFFRISTACPQCHGEGQVIKEKCETCNGKKRLPKERKIQLNVPAGVESGVRLVLRGEGEAGTNGGLAGDLYALLAVENHKEFHRDGDDILSEVTVSFPELALGTAIEVNTIEGPKTVDIKAGTQSGDIVTIRHAGVANMRSQRRGDHLLSIQAETPKKLTKTQKELMQKLANEFSSESSKKAKTNKKKKKKGLFCF